MRYLLSKDISKDLQELFSGLDYAKIIGVVEERLEFDMKGHYMNAKENKFLKMNLLMIIGIFVIFAVIWYVSGKVSGNYFTDYLFWGDFAKKYNDLEPEQLRFEFDREDIVSLESVAKKDGKIIYTLCPLKKGMVYMKVCHAKTGEEIKYTSFHVLSSGIIVNDDTRNYTNYQSYSLLVRLLCFVLTIVLWIAFCLVQRKLRFSYQSIFYSGLAIWMTLISILLARIWYLQTNMLNIYIVLQDAASDFMTYSFPAMFIFCIALSISNIQLIRKEGFRTRNALGIAISIVMLLGFVVDYWLGSLFSTTTEFGTQMVSAFTGIYSSIYAFMECFLIGSILCGLLAAKHEPTYDMDYLIILGCQVKKDGGLYPLIQGRVDRAIEFYHKQLEKTGKKAVFVPSGGQGSDETISEAAAMKRYLLEQGIPEEQILAEDQSKNTVENMRFSYNIIQERTPDAKVAFSTTNFHVFRSGIISRQNQLEFDGMGSKTKWYFWPNAFIREVIGMMAYKWKAIVIVLLPIIAFFIAIQFVG